MPPEAMRPEADSPPPQQQSPPVPVPPHELELLAKLEAANRLIEADAKSLGSLSGASGHSRKGSDTSQVSLTSG